MRMIVVVRDEEISQVMAVNFLVKAAAGLKSPGSSGLVGRLGSYMYPWVKISYGLGLCLNLASTLFFLHATPATVPPEATACSRPCIPRSGIMLWLAGIYTDIGIFRHLRKFTCRSDDSRIR